MMHEDKMPTVSAVIVAAGASQRMGFDKLSYRLPCGKTVLESSVAAFSEHPAVTELILVAGENQDACRAAAAWCAKPCRVVRGGAHRADSVRAGVLAASGELIAIHDAARPYVRREVITDALRAAWEMGAAVPAVPVKDTVKVAKADGTVDYTPDRKKLYAAQTPQCFNRELYLQAIREIPLAKASMVTDDASLFEMTGRPVALTKGDYENAKLTTPDDLPPAKGEAPVRVGHGYDVHRLVVNRKLILGGVEIPFEKGLLGHSDADVLLHAVMDALLGSAALGDIGQHFPDTDPAYKDISSRVLLQEVGRFLRDAGYVPVNIDATILCQKPKLSAFIPQMRTNIARDLKISSDVVNIKATTEEGLGFTGAGEGIAAHAVALVAPNI